MKYEYKIEDLYIEDEAKIYFIDWLNEFGRRGWQLVDYKLMPGYKSVILQREIKVNK